MREEIGIKKDLFGLLGGRETYVLDKSGTVQLVFNDQFGPEKHVPAALETLEMLAPEPNAGFSFELPNFDFLFGKE